MNTQSARRLRRIAFALLPALVLVASMEIAARILTRDVARATRPFYEKLLGGNRDAVMAHEAMHWTRLDHAFVADEYAGYRVKDPVDPAERRPPYFPPAPKAPGEVRVLVAGDSVSFYNNANENWPCKLQERLDAWASPGVRFAVFNGAVPGHNSMQTKRLLQGRWIELDPDIVIWYESPAVVDRIEPPDPRAGAEVLWLRRAWQVRSLYLLMSLRQWARWGDEGVLHRLTDAPPAYREGDVPDALPATVQWLGARGVRAFVGVEYFGWVEGRLTRLDSTDGSPSYLTAASPGLYVGMASPRERFAAEPGLPNSVFADFVHLTPRGMELVADAVFAHVRDHWSEIAPQPE